MLEHLSVHGRAPRSRVPTSRAQPCQPLLGCPARLPRLRGLITLRSLGLNNNTGISAA
jgi:hypothetical protein